MRRVFSQAFTVSELLIALAILGLIAAFTLPKLLNNSAEQQRKVIGKEAIAALQDALNQGF